MKCEGKDNMGGCVNPPVGVFKWADQDGKDSCDPMEFLCVACLLDAIGIEGCKLYDWKLFVGDE